MNKLPKILFLIALCTYILTLFLKPDLPQQKDIHNSILTREPSQEEIKADTILKKFDDLTYELTPLYTYEIQGLVVSEHDTKSLIDVSHKEDPWNTKDLCLVWGENIKNGAYRKVAYESGDFTCFFKWSKPIDPPFSFNHIANNHVIPANKQVEETIKKIKIGDQIKLKGKLVNYKVQTKDQQVFTRSTSTVRTDTGNGACEILYVESIEILRPSASVYYPLKTASFWLMAVIAGFTLIRPFLPFKTPSY